MSRRNLNLCIYPIILGFLYFHFSTGFNQKNLFILKEKLTLLNIIYIISLICIFYLVHIVRWFFLLKNYNKKLKFRDAAIISLITSAVNTLFIINIGEVLKAKLLSKHLKVPIGYTFGTIFAGFLYTILNTLTIITFLTLSYFYNSKHINDTVNPNINKYIFMVLTGLLLCFSFIKILILFFRSIYHRYSRKEKINQGNFILQFSSVFTRAFSLKIFFISLACFVIQIFILAVYVLAPFFGVENYMGNGLEVIDCMLNNKLFYTYAIYKHDISEHFSLIASMASIRHTILIIIGLILYIKYKGFFTNKENKVSYE